MYNSFLHEIERRAPYPFVWLVAGVLAVMYMKRATLPSLLTLIGVIVSFFGTYLSSFWDYYDYYGRLNINNQAQLLVISDVVGRYTRAIGLCLFVAAIFVGRSHAPRADRYLHE